MKSLIKIPVLRSIQNNPQSFGSLRAGGRLHAGVDLKVKAGTEVYAMELGIVSDVSLFYRNVWAITVISNSITIRYCELSANRLRVVKGDVVVAGELLGYVGIIEGLHESMLHLEMYTGTEIGRLTDVNNPPYMRRGDLIDPTECLLKILPIK